jgi:hydrogenase expression/formation protein HypE
MYLANEGKLAVICDPSVAPELLRTMQGHPSARDAAMIGEVREDALHMVEMRTAFGGKRLIDWRYSDPLPRIC